MTGVRYQQSGVRYQALMYDVELTNSKDLGIKSNYLIPDT